jgi:DNA ligase (NAD+)
MTARTTTWLLDLVVQVDSEGVATPVAMVTPAQLDQRIVDRARLHSIGLLRETDLRIHDAVIIEANGGEMPVIASVLADRRKGDEPPLVLPTICPSCAAELRQSAGDVICPNAACPQQLMTHVLHLASSEAFAIPALDRDTIESLIKAGLIVSPADVFRLRERYLKRLAQWPVTRARELVKIIEDAKHVTLDRFLVALSIRGVTASAARSLADQARSITGLKHLSPGTIARLPHVGATAAENVFNFLREPANRKMIAKMLRAGVVIGRRPSS